MQAQKFTNPEVNSSDAFEGPEKTLRLFLEAAMPSDPRADKGLLLVPRSEWESALDLVKCKVLSVLVHPQMHAYVLSESSLFVYPKHLVLKTCGTTTLIDGLSRLIEIVAHHTPITGIAPVFTTAFYSRRSYFKPENQCHPHGYWGQEVARLQQYFTQFNFSSHAGVSKDERWHFFSHAPPPKQLEAPKSADLVDGFLELMMTGLDEECASRFFQPSSQNSTLGVSLEDSVMSLDSTTSFSSAVGAEPDDDDPGHALGNVMTRQTDIDALFVSDRQTIDSFAFSPCGYSCNGVLLDVGKYFTIHVTPEPGYSYASFETNVMDPESIEHGLTHLTLVKRVLNVFGPSKITFVTCAPRGTDILADPDAIGQGYVCTSMAEFDIGSAKIMQCTLKRLD